MDRFDKRKRKTQFLSILVAFMLVIATVVTFPTDSEVKAGTIGVQGGDDLVLSQDSGGNGTFYLQANPDADGTPNIVKTRQVSGNGADLGEVTSQFVEGASISMESNTTLDIQSNTNINSITMSAGAGVTIEAGKTLTTSSIKTGAGVAGATVTNNGTITGATFNLASDFDGVTITNNGTITANNVTTGTNNPAGTGTIKVSGSFNKNNTGNLTNKVVATAADTTITSTGGTFTLSYNGMEREVTGAVNGTAQEVIRNPITLSRVTFDDVYVGTTFNESVIRNKIDPQLPDDYDGSYSIVFMNGDWPVEGGPDMTSYHSYEVRISAAATAKYKSIGSDVGWFNITYMDLPDNPITIDGLTNGHYAKEAITVKPTSGYKVCIENGEDVPTFQSSISLGENDLYGDDSYINEDTVLFLQKSDNGAQTEWDPFMDYLPEEEIIFDAVPPTLTTVNPLVDGKATAIKNESTVTAEKVELTLKDDHFDKISAGGAEQGSNLTIGNGIDANGQAKLTFVAEEGNPKNCTVTAYDMSGNTYTLLFVLQHPNDAKEEEEEPIAKKAPSLQLSIASFNFYNVGINPKATTDSDGKIFFMYKNRGTDSPYVTDKPTQPGNYTVKAIVPETSKFLRAETSANFNIGYLDPPGRAYGIEGEVGNNGYFVDTVTVKAPPGFLISVLPNGGYSDSVLYNSSIKYVYLERIKDGARTGAVNFIIKIDPEEPILKTFGSFDGDGNPINLLGGGPVYADDISFSIMDEHLLNVLVNGQKVKFTGSEALVKLSANGRAVIYVVKAEDEAGNIYTFTFELKAEWMKTNTIPPEMLIPLTKGVRYKLSEGKWTVDGDKTVYNAGSVYVNESNDHTFHKVY